MVYPEVFAKKAGLDPAKDKFTPGNQDRMALYGYIMGQGGVTEALQKLMLLRSQIRLLIS